MKARDRKPNGAAARARVVQPLDQDTKKISAFQLAEVLARVDGDDEAKPLEPRRTVSGTRPVLRPLSGAAPSADGALPTLESSSEVDIPVAQLAPVIERPVAETQVLNATAPVAPEALRDDLAPAPPADPIEPSAEPAAPSEELVSPEVELDADAPAVVVAASRGRGRIMGVLIALVLFALAGALVSAVYR